MYQKLIRKADIAKLPPLYSQEKNPTPNVVVKFFTPWTKWTWYATEGKVEQDDNGNVTDILFFGLVEGDEKELGYFTLAELQEIRGPFGLRIERDMHFDGHILKVDTKEVLMKSRQ